MSFQVHVAGSSDLVVQVYRQVREAILDGRLRPGERLPPTRELARSAAVSRNTVSTAYERLLAEGFITARVGSGTFVDGAAAAGRPAGAAPGGSLRPRRVWQDLPGPGPKRPVPRYDLRAGVPDAALFPLPAWRRLVTRELRTSTMTAGSYADPAGHPALRAAVARWLGISRSVRTGAGDVLITNGAQQALDIIGRVLVEPGDVVAVEEPGYPPARHLFRSQGATVVGVPVDAEGLVVDALPPAARIVYTTPSHQFPMGVPMSPARRGELLSWAERHDSAIVEDDYDSEFRFEKRPLEPLQSLDAGGRVIYVGSFSKTMLPALRLGFLVTPATLRPAMLLARQVSDWHGDACTEAALAAFIEEGLFARHLRAASRVYAERRTLLLGALDRELARWLAPVSSAAGLHLSAHLRPDIGVDAATVVARAERAGIAVTGLAAFCLAPPERDGLVIGYGCIPTDQLPAALRLLARCFRPG
ncbi:GntR family transcriptional regulator [Actinoplanes sp. ATCC 53533]|uniref:MocR-like pyridoxine biosynthesis transcription factor PdxR n=1 Tax=Actinoplanes sp. ATCC 53533 TaxID=1288362 RepID=UPI000F77F5AB|nr:PLP-dependent aminotransferase family protein [Actinoplanes sp. ATCC 53533]RSM53709.1 GntR family transcriptional regulator [Actinoplanes sp. ATCC 53533]